ncbi:hypothetical protein [Bradyrhizobium sp. USDA 329]
MRQTYIITDPEDGGLGDGGLASDRSRGASSIKVSTAVRNVISP